MGKPVTRQDLGPGIARGCPRRGEPVPRTARRAEASALAPERQQRVVAAAACAPLRRTCSSSRAGRSARRARPCATACARRRAPAVTPRSAPRAWPVDRCASVRSGSSRSSVWPGCSPRASPGGRCPGALPNRPRRHSPSMAAAARERRVTQTGSSIEGRGALLDALRHPPSARHRAHRMRRRRHRCPPRSARRPVIRPPARPVAAG